MFCPDGVVDIPEACGALLAQRAFNPGSNPGRDVSFTVNKGLRFGHQNHVAVIHVSHQPRLIKESHRLVEVLAFVYPNLQVQGIII
jgi:hypothetical protein